MAIKVRIIEECSSANRLEEKINVFVNELYSDEKLIDIKYSCTSTRSGSTVYSAMIITERN